MTLSTEISVSDIVNCLIFSAAVVALFYNRAQMRASAKIQRAQFLKDLYLFAYSDSNIQNAFYLIEYGHFQYPEEFHDNPIERDIDRLLSHFDLICHLYALGIITKAELKPFRYRFTRVINNAPIRHYFNFLDDFFAQHHQVDVVAFSSFRAYCQSSGLIMH